MEKNTFYLRFLLLVVGLSFGSFLFWSCSIDNKLDTFETISINLPEWPPSISQDNYPELSKWIIKIRGENVDEKMEVPLQDCNQIILKAEKNKPLCITATPITLNKNNQEVSFFKCAGVVYPQNFEKDDKKGKLQLTWENGFSAYLMELLYNSASENGHKEKEIQDYIASFNWKKLQQYVRGQISSYEENLSSDSELQFYNPWLLDLQTVLEKIAARNFTATALNLKSTFQISVEEKLDSEIATEAEPILSSFVPENQIIQKYGTITIAKNKAAVFSADNLYGVIFTGSSAKNVSIEYVFLPIFINDEKY